MEDLAALKAVSRLREHEERRVQERRRNIVVLILRHLCDNGYTESYERLCTESGVSLLKVLLACLLACYELWKPGPPNAPHRRTPRLPE
jgi:katanin p60 ATPase-containing subunit A1